MSAAAAALAETIRRSGARRAAFLGLSKNVGKTTALVAVLREMHGAGVIVGATSAGRDGEEFDALTGEPKPRFGVWPGQLVASASATWDAASFPFARIRTLDFSTRFGPIQIGRAEGPGEIEVIGPSTASQMASTAGALEEAGARMLLLDGAVGRRAFACARVADGIVLSAGMAAGATLEAALSAAREAAELIRLPAFDPALSNRFVDGALTGITLRENPPNPGEVLVADDFTSIFLDPLARRGLRDRRVGLAVCHAARLLAVTANPTAPGRAPIAARKLFDALRSAIPGSPVFDLVADLHCS